MISSKITSFTKLKAWQKGHTLVLAIYKITNKFPSQEQFGLTSQIRRAVVSITSNIAEGFSRQTRADKIHFYHMALGSCTEVQNQLIVARDLSLINNTEFQSSADLSVEVHKILNGLIKSIKVIK